MQNTILTTVMAEKLATVEDKKMSCARLSTAPRIVYRVVEVNLWPFLSFGTRWEWMLRRTFPPLYTWVSMPGADWTGKWLGPGVGMGTRKKGILCPAIIAPRNSICPVRSLVTTVVNLFDSERLDRMLTLIATFFSTLGFFMSCVKFHIYGFNP